MLREIVIVLVLMRVGAQSTIDEQDVWTRPWVDTREAQNATLPALKHGSPGSDQMGPIPVRLDDGSIAAMTVAPGPCGPQDACLGPREDCGCFETDSFWIRIATSGGSEIKRLHFWAAYGVFVVVPVDLVDGAGDELLIFRMRGRGAPPLGHDIKIWSIDQAMKIPAVGVPRELASSERVSGWLPIQRTTRATPCVRWKMTFTVDRSIAKPLPVGLHLEFGATPDCPVEEKTAFAIEKLQPQDSVRFNPVTGKYKFPVTGLPKDQ
jgi:hypothetical protein